MELQQQLRLERIRTASLSLPLLVGAFLCLVQVVSRGPFYATFERDGRSVQHDVRQQNFGEEAK